MMDWRETLAKLTPVVASAFLGPLSGSVITAVGSILGIGEPTVESIGRAIEDGKLTGEHIAAIRELELKLKAEEDERGFRYADLEFKDRDSARNMFIQTGAKTPAVLTWIIVAVVLALEGCVLFGAKPQGVSEIVFGRILGTMDMALATVLSYWFGTTNGSARKTDLMAQGK